MSHALRKPAFPAGSAEELDLLLAFLAFVRDAVVRKLEGLSEDDARRLPEGKLISLLGIVNHLTHVEWRWIDGGMSGEEVSRSEDEFFPAEGLTVDEAIAAYRARAAKSDEVIRAMSLTDPCSFGEDLDLRWVLLHLIEETARHAGHADAVRELLDGTTGV